MSEGLSLNLSSAKETSFEPVPAAWYDATIFDVSVIQTENPEGKLPVGTPGINVQFKIDHEGQDRRVFRRYYMVQDGQHEKADIINGMLLGFLKDAGEDEGELRKKSYKLVPEDLQGRPIRVKVKVRPADPERGYEASNEVTATKPPGEGVEQDNALGALV